MSQNAINYLKENKDKYPADVLKQQLVKSGYNEQDINDSLRTVYGEIPAGQVGTTGGKNNFWDFKSPMNYTTSGDKIRDLVFGFLAPWVVSFVGTIIPFVGFIFFLLVLPAEIVAIIYFFKRRKFISFGILANMGAGIVIVILFLLVMAGGNFLKF